MIPALTGTVHGTNHLMAASISGDCYFRAKRNVLIDYDVHHQDPRVLSMIAPLWCLTIRMPCWNSDLVLGIVKNGEMRILNAGFVGFQRPLRRWQGMLRTRPDAVTTVGFRKRQLQLLAYRCFSAVGEIQRYCLVRDYRPDGLIQECCFQIPGEATCSSSVQANKLCRPFFFSQTGMRKDGSFNFREVSKRRRSTETN